MRRLACACACVCVCAQSFLGAAFAEAPRAQFQPGLFGPGEPVRVILKLPELGSREGFMLERGKGLPASEDPELLDLEVAKAPGGWELRVRFVPWSPGPGRIPSMNVQGLTLPAIPYSVSSRLEPGRQEPTAPRPQRDPPNSAFYLYGLAGAAILLAFLVVAAFAWLLPAARELAARWRAAQAYRRLCDGLDFLAAGAGEADPAAYYAALSRILRNYLGERIEAEAPALTATELAALPSSVFPAEGLRDEAASLLSEAELARYAGFRPGAAAMAEAADRARELARLAEEGLDARL